MLSTRVAIDDEGGVQVGAATKDLELKIFEIQCSTVCLNYVQLLPIALCYNNNRYLDIQKR